jgi:hypothetical protein
MKETASKTVYFACFDFEDGGDFLRNLVNLNRATLRYIQEGTNLHSHHCENHKFNEANPAKQNSTVTNMTVIICPYRCFTQFYEVQSFIKFTFYHENTFGFVSDLGAVNQKEDTNINTNYQSIH